MASHSLNCQDKTQQNSFILNFNVKVNLSKVPVHVYFLSIHQNLSIRRVRNINFLKTFVGNTSTRCLTYVPWGPILVQRANFARFPGPFPFRQMCVWHPWHLNLVRRAEVKGQKRSNVFFSYSRSVHAMLVQDVVKTGCLWHNVLLRLEEQKRMVKLSVLHVFFRARR